MRSRLVRVNLRFLADARLLLGLAVVVGFTRAPLYVAMLSLALGVVALAVYIVLKTPQEGPYRHQGYR